jgi:hypothetical protein
MALTENAVEGVPGLLQASETSLVESMAETQAAWVRVESIWQALSCTEVFGGNWYRHAPNTALL